MNELHKKFTQLHCINKQIIELEHKVTLKKNKNKIKDILSKNQIEEAIKMHKSFPNNFDLNNYIIKTVEEGIKNNDEILLKSILTKLEYSELYNKCKQMIFRYIVKALNLDCCNFDDLVGHLETIKSFYGDVFTTELQKIADRNFENYMRSNGNIVELDRKIINLTKCISLGILPGKNDVYCILEGQYIKKVIKENHLQDKDDIDFFKHRIMERVKLVNDTKIEANISELLSVF